MSNDYILSDASEEKYRMQLLEREFDALSQRRLLGCPIKEGDHCLEIGAGAGSVARWMSDRVGRQGSVIAVDKNPQHFSNNGRDNISLITDDITSPSFVSQHQNSFDIIHTRFVLVHIQQCENLIAQLTTLLRPGGWLVFEEPDFTSTMALDDNADSDFKAIAALQKLIMQHGENTGFAKRLPYLFQTLGLSNIQAEGYVPINHGQSSLAEMHLRTMLHLKEALLDAKLIEQNTLDNFLQQCTDPFHWTRECQIICISGKKCSH